MFLRTQPLKFLQLKHPYSNRRVLCQGFPRVGFKGMIHFSQPYQLHPTPLITMPLCAAPTALTPTPPSPTCEMLLCCLVPPQLEHLPLHPPTPLLFLHSTQTTPPFFQPHYADCFQRTSKKEKQREAAGDNETAGYAKAVHFGILYFLSHIHVALSLHVLVCGCSTLLPILPVVSISPFF